MQAEENCINTFLGLAQPRFIQKKPAAVLSSLTSELCMDLLDGIQSKQFVT